jgi:hypothetical protein
VQPWEAPFSFMKNGGGTITIGDRGGTDHHKQNEAECVGQEMALATLHLLGRIKSLLTAHFSRWHALRVNYPNTWFGVAPGLSTYIAAE